MDLSQYSTEELQAMLGQQAPSQEAPSQGLAQRSTEELKSALSETVSEPKAEPQTWGDYLRQKTAAGLIGAREMVPFAKDVAAATKATLGVPGVSAPTGDFAAAKEGIERQQAAAAEESPYAYGAGEIAGGIASVAAPEAAGAGLISKGAKAEQAIVSKLAPILGSTTEAKIAAGALTGAGAGAAQSAIHGMGTGTSLEERLGHAEEEILPGAAMGVVGTGLGHVVSRVGRKVGELAGGIKPLPEMPSAEQLLKSGREAYEKSKAQYLHVKTPKVRELYNETLRELEEHGYDPDVHPSLKPALRKLRDAVQPQSLEQLDRIQRMTTGAMKNWQKPEDQMLAGIIRRKMDDFLENLEPTQTISKTGDPSDAIEALREGRHFWKQGRKQQLLDEAKESAKLRAESTGSGGNFPNAYRQEVKKIYQKAKKQGKLWTQDELDAMRDFVRGGQIRNLMRAVEILNPFKHRTMGALEVMHGMGDPLGSLVGAAAGTAATAAEKKLSEKAARRMSDIVSGGGKKSNLPFIKPEESIYGRIPSISAMETAVTRPSPRPVAEDREERASGGKVGKRDYPAKRLNKMERAARRAQRDIALETTPLMQRPDEQIAQALRIAKGES